MVWVFYGFTRCEFRVNFRVFCSCSRWFSLGSVLMVNWFEFEAMMGRECFIGVVFHVFASDDRVGINFVMKIVRLVDKILDFC
jgi:hypothetical protein